MKINRENIVMGVVIIAIVIVGYIYYRNYKKKKAEEPDSAPSDAEGDVKDLEKKLKQTFPNSQYSSFADSIHESLKYNGLSSWEDKPEVAEDILKQMQNDLDIAKLIDAYGLREEQFFGIGTGKQSLFQTITSNFSQSRKASVNANWSTKSITYRL